MKIAHQFSLILLVLSVTASSAHCLTPEPRPFTVCSQNLKNYGVYEFVKSREIATTREGLKLQERALIKRFQAANCDVIAVQELVGKTVPDAQKSMTQLIEAIKLTTGREYEGVVAKVGDGFIRSGMLFAKDRASLLQAITYENIELPKLLPKQKPRYFERPPLEVQLEARVGSNKRVITFIVYHLKSKANAKGDAAELQWETYRMEMAEALRQIAEVRHKANFQRSDSLLVVLGDRNANFDLATAKILEGSVTLNSFRIDGPCRLSKRGVPICKQNTAVSQQFFSVLTTDPETKLLPGTYIYKKEYSWIDDISLPAPSLPFAREKAALEGNYDSFVVRSPPVASDHALVGVRLRW